MAFHRCCWCLALAGCLAAVGLAHEPPRDDAAAAFALDDECAGEAEGEAESGPGPSPQERCGLSALQRRALRAKARAEAKADAEADAEAGQVPYYYGAPYYWGGGAGTPWAPSWMPPAPSWTAPTWGASPWTAPTWGATPGMPSAVPAPALAPAPAPTPAAAAAPQSDTCASLNAAANAQCRKPITWVANQGGKHDPDAPSWFKDMKDITGVDYLSASMDDFQRMYYCSPPGGNACGAPPCSCSKPPCNTCYGGAPPVKKRPGCEDGRQSIDCVPPKRPMDYKGMAWPTMTFSGADEMHFIAIGDWGGMDGSLNPIEGRAKIMAYSWGARPGPSVFPRTRWNKYHSVELCGHKDFVECYNSHGRTCPTSCGYVPTIDEQPQQLVAKAMEQRAALVKPQLILNVGDNFYWGGIEKTCGTPMDQISFTAHHQFDQVFETVYRGPGLSGVPWLSVLGNHDWGGRQFNNGWDQQIAYTWANTRWVMPAPYYMVHVDYPTQAFSADIFMIDTNFLDAKSPEKDSEHNLCGAAHNPANADCSAADGPSSIYTCEGYFDSLWREQQAWLEQKLSRSSATWQIVVTHFPCGEDGAGGAFYRKLRSQYGLDLLVTGHRHDQELWEGTETWRNYMGGLTCIVTGGGGGISSEATPDPMNKQDWMGEAQYGFFDITITKQMMTVESINWDGTVMKTSRVYPSR